MGRAFFILQALAIFFAVVYMLQKLFSPRRGAGSRAPGLFGLSFFLALVVAVFFPSDVRYFSIDLFKTKVVSVDGPNAFTVKAGRKVRLVLSGTVAAADPAEAQKAEQALRARILGKKVAVDFPPGDRSQPRPAEVFLDKANLADLMISEGLLQRAAGGAPAAAKTVPGAAPATSSVEAPAPAAAVPGALPSARSPEAAKRGAPFSRFFVWFIIGCVGAGLFSRALLGRKVGLDIFLLFVLVALRDMAIAVRADTSLAPPIIAVAVALIAGPGLRSADLWAPLRERMR